VVWYYLSLLMERERRWREKDEEGLLSYGDYTRRRGPKDNVMGQNRVGRGGCEENPETGRLFGKYLKPGVKAGSRVRFLGMGQ